MALETKLLQKMSQSLLMTPQLQQAIKLLQLGRLEYKEAIENELLENPVLEEIREGDDGSAAPPVALQEREPGASENSMGGEERNERSPAEEGSKAEQTSVMEWETYLEAFADSRGMASPKGTVDFEDRPSLEATLTKEMTLEEHLLEQLRMTEIDNVQEQILLTIIGNLSREGYLTLSYEEVAEECRCSVGDVANCIETLKTLEPVGIGARNLPECLIFQLESIGLDDDVEGRMIKQHLDKLEKRKYEQIAKAEGVTLERISKALTTIQSLDPKPGRAYGEDATRYVVPDIYVHKVGNEWVITLNEDGLPKLRVSPYYLKLLQGDGASANPNKAYLNERLKAASWLIKSIHQRQQTIFRVTESIVKFQRAFLEQGIERLKPLVLKDVADDIGMHESTVSRVTTNKYVHTPQGIFELKFFFTSGLKSGEGDVSSSSVKERIRALIAAETPENPLSDQALAEILKGENIMIARRTVAKYREGLGILSSSQRKKVF